jgi:hypothetical protein
MATTSREHRRHFIRSVVWYSEMSRRLSDQLILQSARKSMDVDAPS